MRISDWSSDVCASDLERLCRDDDVVDREQGLRLEDDALDLFPVEGGSVRRGGRRHRRPIWRCARDRSAARRTGARRLARLRQPPRSEEHTSELQSLMRISYAVFCLKKKKTSQQT